MYNVKAAECEKALDASLFAAVEVFNVEEKSADAVRWVDNGTDGNGAASTEHNDTATDDSVAEDKDITGITEDDLTDVVQDDEASEKAV